LDAARANVASWHLDGVIGRRLWIAEDFGVAAVQADGETRSADAASNIRRRSAAGIILLDWTYDTSVCIVDDTGRIVREVKGGQRA
jgi:hypothetical protein